jgi:hypothetical protein
VRQTGKVEGMSGQKKSAARKFGSLTSTRASRRAVDGDRIKNCSDDTAEYRPASN